MLIRGHALDYSQNIASFRGMKKASDIVFAGIARTSSTSAALAAAH
jgi:hypothetical protein